MKLADSKYEVVGNMVLRNGEPWRDITGDKFTYLLVDEVNESRRIIAEQKATLETLLTPANHVAPTVEDAHILGTIGAAPSETERLLFESWMRGHCWQINGIWNGFEYDDSPAFKTAKVLDPQAMQTRMLFAAWRDSAALHSPR